MAARVGKSDRQGTQMMANKDQKKITNEVYETEVARMQIELVKLQEWVKQTGHKVAIIFDGRGCGQRRHHMDLESSKKWAEYSCAKDMMFAHTDIKQAP
ncbi:MAG: polyphosphate kinase 2 (PPK2 family) [Paracoccaceae bacterium]